MIRFALGLFPAQAQRFGSALMVLAVLSALWGALLTLAQPTLRRMVAAVSIGQMSLVLLAVAAPNTISLDGAVLQLVAGGLSSALLLLLCGAIEGRTRSAPLDRLGGLAAQAPRLGGFWIFALPRRAGGAAARRLQRRADALHRRVLGAPLRHRVRDGEHSGQHRRPDLVGAARVPRTGARGVRARPRHHARSSSATCGRWSSSWWPSESSPAAWSR